MTHPPKLYDEASMASAENGVVIVDGPDGVDVSLTPEAAVETSHWLLEAGVTAQGQKRLDAKKPRRS